MSKKCAVILAKCQKTKNNYGVRMEQQIQKINNRDVPAWMATWTYKIKTDADARSSGVSSQQNLQGDLFLLSASYPGCPYCGNKKLTQCGECKKTLCSAEDQSKVVCPSCNASLSYRGDGVSSVGAGGDRC
jgi:predicted RNA-binding Zn-ribbon protein involved in translation (DUF1610 family)